MTTFSEADVKDALLACLTQTPKLRQPCDQTLYQVAIGRTITLQLAEA